MWSHPIAECHPKQITESILQFKVSLLSAKLKVVQSLQCPSARLPSMNWILEQLKTISRWWELQAPGLEAKGPAGTALVALAKRFCSVLCCLIFNWVLHLGTLRLQLLRPQLRGCSVRQASLWTPNGTSCVHLLLISCCSSERLTFWVCASYPGSRDLVSVYISVFSCV